MNLPATAPAPDENKLIAERRDKLAQLRTQGVAFPNDFKPTQHAGALQLAHGGKTNETLEPEAVKVAIAGRVLHEEARAYFQGDDALGRLHGIGVGAACTAALDLRNRVADGGQALHGHVDLA